METYSAALLALPLVAAMALAACGGAAKPEASSSTKVSSPTSTSAATATTTASPATPGPTTDPNIPAGAREHTPAGAEAFVKYFIEQSNVAWTVPRAGMLSPLCQASSVACAALETTATRLAAEGHRYNGNPITITFIGALDSMAPNQFNVLANVVQERRSEVDATGKIYVTDPRKDLRLEFDLFYTGQAWSVSSLNPTK